jgi:hypothetical protein
MHKQDAVAALGIVAEAFQFVSFGPIAPRA